MPSSFDMNWYSNSDMELRTKKVKIPDIMQPAMRKKDGEPFWTVRQLEDADIVRAEEERTELIPRIVEAATSSKDSDQLDAIKAMLGIDDSSPSGTRKKAYYISVASIDPTADRPGAAKLLRNHPIFANSLVTAILELTQLGAEMGKRSRSTVSPKSEAS